ncbi:MAG: hypothetical protein R3330_00175 [Saprospiraceae bacterium]|nr:hypothetical protein [Saprospiraceae bacterium]
MKRIFLLFSVCTICPTLLAQHVGINVDTPLVELDIRTLSTDDGSELNLGNLDNSHWLRFFSGRDAAPFPIMTWRETDPFILGTDGSSFTERMRITSGGDVGIAASSPTGRLHLYANSLLDYPQLRLTEEGFDFARIKFENTGTPGAYFDLAGVPHTDPDIAKFNFYYWDGTIGGNYLTILGNGNIGMRVDTPSVELDVRTYDTDNAAQLNVGNSDNSYFLRLFSGRDGVPFPIIYWRENLPLLFGPGNEIGFVEKMRLTNAGYLGLGTSTPAVKLDVNDMIRTGGNTWPATGKGMEFAYDPSINQGYIQVLDRDLAQWGSLYLGESNVGIGTLTPASRLTVAGLDNDGVNATVAIQSGGQTMLLDGNEIDAVGDALYLNHNSTGGVTMATNGGDVRIGTWNGATGYKLSVAGKIIAEEVRIQLQGLWPDYVFDPGYQLPELREIAEFVHREHHLPGIPAAEEVQSDGLMLGEMQAMLLKKIEELTLYVIQQDAQIRKLQQELASLNQRQNLQPR